MKKKRNMSIKAKLLGIIIPVMVAIVVVLVLVAYEMSSGIIGNYSENLLESSVDNQANEIESWLNKNIAGIKSAKKTIEQLKPDNEEMQNILDGYYGFDENYPDGIYIADSNGNLMKASESDKSESDVTGSVWYKEGLTRVNPKVGSAYKNSKGENVISASAAAVRHRAVHTGGEPDGNHGERADDGGLPAKQLLQIGRASCRERV